MAPTRKTTSKTAAIARLKARIAGAVELETQLVGQVRLILDARTEKCADDCPGWFVGGWFVGDRGVERCDECAALNGYQGAVSDSMIALLPEAYDAMRKHADNEDRDQATMTRRVIEWLRAHKPATDDVAKLRSKRSVQLAALLLDTSPTWIAERMLGRK